MNNEASQRQIRVALGSVPKDGGTFTFFRNLRPALLPHGIDLRCVTVGLEEARLQEADYISDGCHLLAPRSLNLKTQARAFSDWCADEKIDIAMGINSAAILSSLPHLDRKIRVMARCANAFDQGYRVTMSGRDRLMRIVALSPRLRDDLVAGYGADPDRIELIPNGIDPQRFEKAAATPRGTKERLELGFLGRLEHGQKGVNHLPDLVDKLHAMNVPFRLRIAGKGRDKHALESAMVQHIAANRVEFMGTLGPQDVPDFLGETDIFVFTSRFEGMPNALLEAMMAGCVPVCFNIAGITDFMLEHKENGFLCGQGETAEMARFIATLSADRVQLQTVARDGAENARHRFTNAVSATAYARLFKDVMQEPLPAFEPKPWQTFSGDPNFPKTWKRYIPHRIKSALRNLKR